MTHARGHHAPPPPCPAVLPSPGPPSRCHAPLDLSLSPALLPAAPPSAANATARRCRGHCLPLDPSSCLRAPSQHPQPPRRATRPRTRCNAATAVVSFVGHRRSSPSIRRLPSFPEPASTPAATAVSHRTVSPSPFSLSCAVAAAPCSPARAAACDRRRRASGHLAVRPLCSTSFPRHVEHIGAPYESPRPP